MAYTYTNHPTLGRGRLYFASTADQYVDLGNASEFNLNIELEKKEHFSSRAGLKVRDKNVVVQLTAKGKFVLDDAMKENVQLFFMANAPTDVTQSQTTVTDQALTAKLSKWQPLGYWSVSGVVVQDVTDTTTYTEDTDYYLQLDAGLIYPIDGGSISADDVLHIDYVAATITMYRVDAGEDSSIGGHFWFVSDASEGYDIDAKGYATLTPEGDFAMITDDWRQMSFAVEFETNASYNGLIDLYHRGEAA